MKGEIILKQNLTPLVNRLASIKTDVSELKSDMKNINENILHPDEGIYSRIKKIEHRVEHHAKLHDRVSKIFWGGLAFIVSTIIGVVIKIIVGYNKCING